MKFNTKIGSQKNNFFQEFFTIKIIKFNLTKIRKRMSMSKIGYQPFFTIQFSMAGVLIPERTRDIHYVTFASREPGV
jgi:hypothetical protein